MAINTINYSNKQALNENPNVQDINKVKAADMNEIKTVVNQNANLMGDLSTLTTTSTDSIVNAINVLSASEIIESTLNPDTGYIKYSNGLMVEWQSLTATAGGTAWGSMYYSDHQMGNWTISFTNLFFTIPTSSSALYTLASDAGTNTSAGMIRATRPNEGTANVKFKIIGIGLWK